MLSDGCHGSCLRGKQSWRAGCGQVGKSRSLSLTGLDSDISIRLCSFPVPVSLAVCTTTVDFHSEAQCLAMQRLHNYPVRRQRYMYQARGCLVQVGNRIEFELDSEAIGLQFEPYRWRPCDASVTWDFGPEQSW